MQKKQFMPYPQERMMVKRTQIEISKVKEFVNKIKDAGQKSKQELLAVIDEIEAEIAKLEQTKIPVKKDGPFGGPGIHY